jgi:flagellar transcriptional activator FlhC
MDALTESARHLLALRLLLRHARISIVHHETGLSRGHLRALYRDLHGRSPKSGQLPAVGCSAIRSRRQQVHGSLFAGLYAAHAGRGIHRQLDIDAVVRAYDTFLFMVGGTAGAEIDLNVCWVIARDLRIGTSRRLYCPRCAIHYLVSDNARAPASCPLCALYTRSRSRPSVKSVAEAVAPAMPG